IPRISIAFFVLLRQPQTSTLFPYTTLFRSGRAGDAAALRGAALALGGPAHQIQQLSRIELDVGLEDLRSPGVAAGSLAGEVAVRSEEHTSELQSRGHLVCRLLLEKKKRQNT